MPVIVTALEVRTVESGTSGCGAKLNGSGVRSGAAVVASKAATWPATSSSCD